MEIGIFFWQIVNLVLLATGVYLIYRIYKYITRKKN